jgi:hypothetical protein
MPTLRRVAWFEEPRLGRLKALFGSGVLVAVDAVEQDPEQFGFFVCLCCGVQVG